jgi:hypothetical protein
LGLDGARDRLWRRRCRDDGVVVVDAHETSDDVRLEVDDGSSHSVVVVPVAVDHHRLFRGGAGAGVMETVGRRLMVAAAAGHHLYAVQVQYERERIAERVKKMERQIGKKVAGC